MGKRIVIALGGNALGNNLPEQMIAVKETARAIADLIEDGHEVVIAHGNGPQVGMIHAAMADADPLEDPEQVRPLSPVRLRGHEPGLYRLRPAERPAGGAAGPGHSTSGVATVLTQVEVDPDGPCLPAPHQAHRHLHDRGGGRADAPRRGAIRWWRTPAAAGAAVVASPKPQAHRGDRHHPGPHRRRAHLVSRPAAAAAFPSTAPRSTTISRVPRPSSTRTSPRSCWRSSWTPTCSSFSPPWRRWP